MRSPNIFSLEVLQNNVKDNQTHINGKWIPSRPIGLASLRHRTRIAWGVFTGKYDAVKWPGGQ